MGLFSDFKKLDLPRFKLLAGIALLALAVSSSAYDCSNLPLYSATPVATGDIIQNNDAAYQCLVGGWCRQGGPYEPGVGWAASTAWAELGSCQVSDNQPPTVTLEAPGTVANGTEVTLAGTAGDPDGVVQRRRIFIDEVLIDEVQVTNGIFEFDYLWLASAGYHTIRVEVEDNEGATASSSANIVVSENAVPEVAIALPSGDIRVDETFEARASASDSDGTINTWKLTVYDYYPIDARQNARPVASGWSSEASMEFSGNLPAGTLPLGTYVLVAEVTDITGAVARETQVFEVQESYAPTINATIPATAELGDVVSMSFSAQPFDSIETGIGTVTIDGKEVGITAGWGMVPPHTYWIYAADWTWEASEVGEHEVVISIDHPNFPDPLVKTITVTGDEPQPSLSISGPEWVELGQTAKFVVSAVDLPEIADVLLTFDGRIINPTSVGSSGAPEPYVIDAVFHVEPDSVGKFAVQATMQFTNGNSLVDNRQLEVIYGCFIGEADPWDTNAVYLAGNLVHDGNLVYEAQFWNRGENPADSSQWGPWKVVGSLSCY